MKPMLAFCCILFAWCYRCQGQESDSLQITKLLEKESATWRSGDVKAHADCWHIQPYSRILVSTPEGRFIDVPPIAMVHPAAGSMGKGGYAVNSHYKISVHGNDAWVSHDETSTALDSTKTFTSEIRILEKINGEWKLVGQSIHVHKP